MGLRTLQNTLFSLFHILLSHTYMSCSLLTLSPPITSFLFQLLLSFLNFISFVESKRRVWKILGTEEGERVSWPSWHPLNELEERQGLMGPCELHLRLNDTMVVCFWQLMLILNCYSVKL